MSEKKRLSWQPVCLLSGARPAHEDGKLIDPRGQVWEGEPGAGPALEKIAAWQEKMVEKQSAK